MLNSWPEVKAETINYLLSGEDEPSEETISRTLRGYSCIGGLNENDSEFEVIFRELRSELATKIPEGVTLQDNEAIWEEWLPDMAETSTSHWDAYKKYLSLEQGAGWDQLKPLDRSTNTILSLLSDPRQEHPALCRKGLVLGDVQSGKTRTYLALMHKAVDYGYKLIIVLTSSDESLRGQTQDRVDTDFLGFVGQRKSVGIGKYLQKQSVKPISLTNEDDFVKAYGKAYQRFPRPSWTDSRPFVAVMKKNGSILNKFITWLDNPEFPKDLPVLIIDDESDYASVNSAKAEDSPTKINSLLRDLCAVSSRTSYVAVTATPFANVFIDDEDETDLFAKDFIHILQPPPAYIGATKLFGDLDHPPIQSHCVKLLDEDELDEWLPLSHKKDYEFIGNELDCQVAYAIDCFLVACTLRPNAERTNQSMLIHMSRFTNVQEQIATMVYDYVRDLANALMFHPNINDPRIEKLHKAYHDEYENCGQTDNTSWTKTLAKLRSLVNRLQVRLVNSAAASWNETHQVPEQSTPDECAILIGGNQLSRGMTLKGLISSVFYRRVTASDTLLQMGRWFGYRPGYSALQRIWLLEQSRIDYRYSSSIIEELKDQSKRMQRNGMTPKQFGIALMKNPNKGVRITSAAKMRSASEESNSPLAEFDLAGQIIESTRLSINKARIESNNAALSSLLTSLRDASSVDVVRSPKSATSVYRHVPSTLVADFLSRYRAGYSDRYFGPTLLHYKDRESELNTTMAAQYVKTQDGQSEGTTTWSVAFINGGGAAVEDVPFHWEEIVRTSSYEKAGEFFAINGSKMRLGSKTDFLAISATESLAPLTTKDVTGSERDYYLTKYLGNDPILMLYKVQVKSDKPQYNDLAPRAGKGLIGAKLIIPTTELLDRSNKGRVYYYNTVATRSEYESLQNQVDEDDE